MQDVAEDVISRAAQGDAGGFEEIVRAYGDLVFNVSWRVVRHRQDAEEVTQEVFLMIYKRLREFQGRSTLKTWIYRIAVNAAINYAKRVAGSRNRTVPYDEEMHPQAVASSIVQMCEREYAVNMADKLLALLSPEQRACVILRNVEGLSYEEIAGVLSIDINAVRSRLKRAREKMIGLKHEVMAHEM